ncbi:hypothetical protein Dsin_003494 [Dipteronia sinensis]|uniref:Jacalin-type lectin domain-containing protein n=1 Tax=Dipteronia sinensis TaxID=43782 RepID=A0AAE0B7T6_9ROSI|nr:hypothetical protein Dsin_003494 [Dipteronia sinensis]
MENSYNWENSIAVGPCWNRPAGDHEWSFKPNGGITEIKLRRRVVIDSITFKSIDEKGNAESSNTFGGDAGGGTPFEFSVKDGVIVGFHGRFGIYVNTIGVYIKHSAELFRPSSQLQTVTPKEQSYNFDNPTKIWYWGSKFLDENEWNYRPNGGIVEITICYSDNEVIHALSFKNVDKNGNVECSRKFGGNGGKIKKVIKLDWPVEYFTSVSWTCETFNGFYVIQSLCFETNKNKYGPFGPTTGTYGKFSMDGVVIVGFHGYHGIYVDGLGYYVKNSTDLFGPLRSGQVVTAKVDGTILMNMDMPRPLGPWGGITGKPWDDERFPFIKQIDVHVYNGIVHAIQIQYHSADGVTVESKRHGGGGVDSTVHRIKLDESGEYISGITGFYGPIDENASYNVVRSISFYSNEGKYGPFGKEIGIFFSSPIYNGKVVGFHGRSGDYLEAIGVHMELI